MDNVPGARNQYTVETPMVSEATQMCQSVGLMLSYPVPAVSVMHYPIQQLTPIYAVNPVPTMTMLPIYMNGQIPINCFSSNQNNDVCKDQDPTRKSISMDSKTRKHAKNKRSRTKNSLCQPKNNYESQQDRIPNEQMEEDYCDCPSSSNEITPCCDQCIRTQRTSKSPGRTKQSRKASKSSTVFPESAQRIRRICDQSTITNDSSSRRTSKSSDKYESQQNQILNKQMEEDDCNCGSSSNEITQCSDQCIRTQRTSKSPDNTKQSRKASKCSNVIPETKSTQGIRRISDQSTMTNDSSSRRTSKSSDKYESQQNQGLSKQMGEDYCDCPASSNESTQCSDQCIRTQRTSKSPNNTKQSRKASKSSTVIPESTSTQRIRRLSDQSPRTNNPSCRRTSKTSDKYESQQNQRLSKQMEEDYCDCPASSNESTQCSDQCIRTQRTSKPPDNTKQSRKASKSSTVIPESTSTQRIRRISDQSPRTNNPSCRRTSKTSDKYESQQNQRLSKQMEENYSQPPDSTKKSRRNSKSSTRRISEQPIITKRSSIVSVSYQNGTKRSEEPRNSMRLTISNSSLREEKVQRAVDSSPRTSKQRDSVAKERVQRLSEQPTIISRLSTKRISKPSDNIKETRRTSKSSTIIPESVSTQRIRRISEKSTINNDSSGRRTSKLSDKYETQENYRQSKQMEEDDFQPPDGTKQSRRNSKSSTRRISEQPIITKRSSIASVVYQNGTKRLEQPRKSKQLTSCSSLREERIQRAVDSPPRTSKQRDSVTKERVQRLSDQPTITNSTSTQRLPKPSDNINGSRRTSKSSTFIPESVSTQRIRRMSERSTITNKSSRRRPSNSAGQDPLYQSENQYESQQNQRLSKQMEEDDFQPPDGTKQSRRNSKSSARRVSEQPIPTKRSSIFSVDYRNGTKRLEQPRKSKQLTSCSSLREEMVPRAVDSPPRASKQRGSVTKERVQRLSDQPTIPNSSSTQRIPKPSDNINESRRSSKFSTVIPESVTTQRTQKLSEQPIITKRSTTFIFDYQDGTELLEQPRISRLGSISRSSLKNKRISETPLVSKMPSTSNVNYKNDNSEKQETIERNSEQPEIINNFSGVLRTSQIIISANNQTIIDIGSSNPTSSNDEQQTIPLSVSKQPSTIINAETDCQGGCQDDCQEDVDCEIDGCVIDIRVQRMSDTEDNSEKNEIKRRISQLSRTSLRSLTNPTDCQGGCQDDCQEDVDCEIDGCVIDIKVQRMSDTDDNSEKNKIKRRISQLSRTSLRSLTNPTDQNTLKSSNAFLNDKRPTISNFQIPVQKSLNRLSQQDIQNLEEIISMHEAEMKSEHEQDEEQEEKVLQMNSSNQNYTVIMKEQVSNTKYEITAPEVATSQNSSSIEQYPIVMTKRVSNFEEVSVMEFNDKTSESESIDSMISEQLDSSEQIDVISQSTSKISISHLKEQTLEGSPVSSHMSIIKDGETRWHLKRSSSRFSRSRTEYEQEEISIEFEENISPLSKSSSIDSSIEKLEDFEEMQMEESVLECAKEQCMTKRKQKGDAKKRKRCECFRRLSEPKRSYPSQRYTKQKVFCNPSSQCQGCGVFPSMGCCPNCNCGCNCAQHCCCYYCY